MYNLPRTIKFFLVAYRLLPFVTDNFFLAYVCVRSTWGAVQAMAIWIHVWSAAHDPFLCCRTQTPALADRPYLFLRVNVSRAGEEAFRRCLFEYMSRCRKPHQELGHFNAEFSESATPRIRPCWFQWCTCPGSSVMTLTWSGKSITQWLGPTPRRYDVKQLEHVVFICM